MKWCEEFARRFEDGRRQLAGAAASLPLRFCARNDHTGAERLRYKPRILFIYFVRNAHCHGRHLVAAFSVLARANRVNSPRAHRSKTHAGMRQQPTR
jgi:head-tail adaptor